MVITKYSLLLGDLLYVILLGAVNRLIGDIIFEVRIFILLFHVVRKVQRIVSLSATLIMGGIYLALYVCTTPYYTTLIAGVSA